MEATFHDISNVVAARNVRQAGVYYWGTKQLVPYRSLSNLKARGDKEVREINGGEGGGLR